MAPFRALSLRQVATHVGIGMASGESLCGVVATNVVASTLLFFLSHHFLSLSMISIDSQFLAWRLVPTGRQSLSQRSSQERRRLPVTGHIGHGGIAGTCGKGRSLVQGRLRATVVRRSLCRHLQRGHVLRARVERNVAPVGCRLRMRHLPHTHNPRTFEQKWHDQSRSCQCWVVGVRPVCQRLGTAGGGQCHSRCGRQGGTQTLHGTCAESGAILFERNVFSKQSADPTNDSQCVATATTAVSHSPQQQVISSRGWQFQF